MKRPAVLVVALVFSALGVPAAPEAAIQDRGPLRFDHQGNAYPDSATSFDCRLASNAVERTICTDSGLAMSDGSNAELYRLLRQRLGPAQRTRLLQSQRAWLTRRNACDDSACIQAAYDSRERELGAALEARDRVLRSRVAQVGQCQTTRIDFIGPRLQRVENEPASGTTIRLENGVRQVSYDREPAALASRLGDQVRVCLISIPDRCPPGDDRGRVMR